MKRKLLIACNNEEDAGGLASAFTNLEQIDLIQTVFSGRQVVDAVLTTQVDLLLMDLFLMDLDGLAVLDYIGQISEDRRPLVFAMTVLPDDKLPASDASYAAVGGGAGAGTMGKVVSEKGSFRF